MNEHYVYVFCDPTIVGVWGETYTFVAQPFYVGEGKGSRMMRHFTCKRNSSKFSKIKQLVDSGLEPLICVIAEGLSKSEARNLERKIIKELGTIKILEGVPSGPLMNLNPGGGGVIAHSVETKEKMRASHLGTTRDPSVGAKISATKLKNGPSEKWREAHLASKVGKVLSNEVKGKIRQSNLGLKRSDETRENMRVAKLGCKWMNNSEVQKFVTPDDVQEYLDHGFVFGRLPSR